MRLGALSNYYKSVRIGTFFLVLATFGVACGGPDEVYETPPSQVGSAEGELTLPAPTPATPAFALSSTKPISTKQMVSLAKVNGVAAMASVERHTMTVSGPKKSLKLRVAAIQPLEFRSVAPAATRDAQFVWLSLMDGNAVTTFDAAEKLGVESGGEIALERDQTIPVGGFADNGTPNIADILVQSPASVSDPHLVVIGADTGVTIETLAADLKKVVPGAKLEKLLPSGKMTVTTSYPQGFAPVPGGFQPAMAQTISQLIDAAQGKVWINSGYRTYAHQAALWQGALEKYGDPEIANNWVAPPGHSMHEQGLAADLGGDIDLAVQLIQDLNLPLWRPMSWEPWHFELSGSRG